MSPKAQANPDWSKSANYFSIVSNAFSAMANFFGLFSFKKKDSFLIKLATKAGEISSKAFYFLNSHSNFKRRLKVKDFLSALGFLVEMVVTPLAKEVNVFLYRGLAVGLYMFANGVKDAVARTKYENFDDHVSSVRLAIKKGLGFLNGNFWENFRSPNTGLQSMLAGILLFIGPIVWKLTGNKLLGTSIRNIGAITQDVSQLKPDYIFSKNELRGADFKKLIKLALAKSLGLNKVFGGSKMASEPSRPWYFRSGLGYVFGTLFDWVGRLFEALGLSKSAVLIPTSLTYIFDGIGAYLLGVSQDKEIGKKVATLKAA